MSDHRSENGGDAEERNEVDRAHALFDRIPTHDVPRASWVASHLAKWGMQRNATVVIEMRGVVAEMDTKLGRVAIEVGSLAKSNQRLANLAEARIGLVDGKIDTLRSEVRSLLDEQTTRIERAIAQRFTVSADASGSRLPSITDELEGENTAVREKINSVRQKDAEAFAELRAQFAQMRQEKHDAEVRAKALAEKKAEDDAAAAKAIDAADKREEKLKRRIAIAIGIGTIVAGVASTAAYTYGRVELRPAPSAPSK